MLEVLRSVHAQKSKERNANSQDCGNEGELPEQLHFRQQGYGAKDNRDFQEQFSAVIVIGAALYQVSFSLHFFRSLLNIYGTWLMVGRFILMFLCGIRLFAVLFSGFSIDRRFLLGGATFFLFIFFIFLASCGLRRQQ